MDPQKTTEVETEQLTQYHLEKEHELRFEIDHGKVGYIKLIEGTGECFGTELVVEKVYKLKGSKGAIFTWHGCVLGISKEIRSYTAGETPMLSYAHVHSFLEERRELAKQKDILGPRVILVGPTDSGKTSISKVLVGYCVRKGGQPTYIDLDVGQGSITIPGVISCTTVDKPVDIQEGYTSNVPLAYFYGQVSMDINSHLLKINTQCLAQSLTRRFNKAGSSISKYSGCIINTAGWVDGLGYEMICMAIETLKVDVICVIDHERLYNDLSNQFKERKDLKLLKLAKSGGVITRNPKFRREARTIRIREYFYGTSEDLCPHSTVVDFKDVTIYKIGGGPMAPSTALPIGAAPTTDPVKLVEVHPSSELLHSILAVSFATSPEQILQKNVAGFLYVTDVNYEKRKITVLAPCPGNLPSRYLVIGGIKWLE